MKTAFTYINVLLFTLILSTTGNSQETVLTESADTTEEKVKKYQEFYSFKKSAFYADTINMRKVDTSLESFFYFSPQLYNFKSNLGINGSPQKSLSFENNIPVTINTSFDHLNDFRFQNDSIKYFELTQPYAKVVYVNGAKKEEGIDLEFSQNVRPNWNWGIEYKKTGAEGFYIRQKTSINNFSFFQSFRTKNNRYAFIGNLLYNDTYNEENGGLKNDTLFEYSAEKITRTGLPVNLSNAKNTSRNQGYSFTQMLNFGKKQMTYYRDENDSLFTDSVIKEWIKPSMTFEHVFDYKTSEYSFEDKAVDTNFYVPSPPYGRNNIHDKLLTADMINQFLVGFQGNDTGGIFNRTSLKAGAGFEYLEYKQYSFTPSGEQELNNKQYENLFITASLANNIFDNHYLKMYGNLFLSGYNSGDYKLGIQSNSKLKIFNLNFRGHYHANSPSLLFRSFHSTLHSWENNNLDKVGELLLDGKASLPKFNFEIGAKYRSIVNYLYFDNKLAIKQFNDDINITSLYAEQLFRVSVFNLKMKIEYQLIDKKGIINLPELLTFNSFYIQSHLFNEEMLFRIGSEVFLTSKYFGDNYNPSLRQFSVQNSREIGLSPIVDFFLMVNVDRAYFFAKLSNALEGIPAYNYYATLNYPMPDRAFKFGIKWEFVN